MIRLFEEYNVPLNGPESQVQLVREMYGGEL